MSTKAELIQRMEALVSKKNFTKEDSALFSSLQVLAGLSDESEDRFRSIRAAEQVSGLRAEVLNNAEKAFRSFVRKGDASEYRTYAPMNEATGSQGGFYVPQQWRSAYQQKLVSASGLLKAGANLLNMETGRPFQYFFADDSGSAAEVLAENAQLSSSANPANPITSVFSPVLNKYATSCIAGSEILNDSTVDLDAALQKFFGQRIARKFNAFATADTTNGIINHLTPNATTVSSTTPSIAELAAMQNQINAGVLEDPDGMPCYMMAPAMKNLLQQQVTTIGGRVYPELASGTLLGYPVVVNVDMPSSAGSNAVVFGSVKNAIVVHSAPLIVVRSIELYATQDSTWFAAFHRMGAKLVDPASISTLALHA
jgi:HK97 family phage major capsid protein